MKRYDGTLERLTIVQVAPDYYPIPPLAYGGIERVVHTLTEQLVRLGHRVILYAPEGSVTSAELVTYTHSGGNPGMIRDKVVRTLPQDVDIIHDHTHSSVIGRLELPIPTVCTLHATVNNGVANPVYLSESSRRAAGGGSGHYIYNGIDPEDFDFSEEKSDYLLFMGVISPHKGVHHALRIAEETGQRLVLAGPVFSMDYFRSEIEPALRRNPRLEYAGEVGGADKRRLLKEARCMLFPTCCEEAFGLVMVEAMASGTPVLALANGAVPEVMSGFPELICRDVEEMKEKLALGLFPESRDLRNYALRMFTHEEMTRRYVELYRRLIDTNIATKNEKMQQEIVSDQLVIRLCEAIMRDEKSTVGQKLAACDEAAELWRLREEPEKEKSYVFRSFEYAAPRAEFCCRLGYLYMRMEDYAKAAYWYRLATQLEPPAEKGAFYIEACWTWLPHVQLCVCCYRLGDVEAAYRHNEAARALKPDDPHVIYNRSFLEPLVTARGPEADHFEEVELEGANGSRFRMSLRLPGFIEETIRERGGWETGLARLIARRMKNGGVFADIGANIGFHSLYIASIGESVHCVSFEPHPELHLQLKENAELNGFTNLTAYECAVADVSGDIDFRLQSMNAYNRGLSGSMQSVSTVDNAFTAARVAALTLDEALSDDQKNRVRAIKIDTQGIEFEVLRGAAETVRRSRPLVAFEYHAYGTRPLEEMMALLPGYMIYKLQAWTGELRRLEEEDPPDFEQDYIALPDEDLLEWGRSED
ncbi:FkbM family methyltransferase [Paenibacillus nanensis]|uniref:FkbM family methyltransferase n=1 Tax=Paenibacillus nanensis TaxID=393251 RepID=UPI0013C2CDCA|nr:FkbM family methyltransferase [Paenibacillus nanensis]